MPERWQRELKKLRSTEPRVDLWTRVEEGPQRSPAHIPGRQRLFAGGVAFAVFIAAGVFAWNVFRPSGTIGDAPVLSPRPGDLVVTLRAPTEPSTTTDFHLPTAVFHLGDAEINIATQGMTGWPDIPAVSFNAALYGLGFSVPVGTRLVIQGDVAWASARLRNGISIDSPTQELDLSGRAAILPSEPGQYVIDLTGSWAEGTATFTAVFDVVPVEQAAVLAFDEQDPQTPELSFTVGGVTVPVLLGTHSWTFAGGNGNADAVTPAFTEADAVQVVSGTPLLLQDPPPTVSIMANAGLIMNWGPKSDLNAPGATFDLPQGNYLVIIDAKWSDAQAEFWLPIEIVQSGVPSPTPQGSTELARAGIVLAYPSGWTPASENLTPALTDPWEIFALATYPLRPGGSSCAQYPVNAIEDLGPSDALIWLAERHQGSAGTPIRPTKFESWMNAAPLDDSADCLSAHKDLVHRYREFSDAGRDFAVYVAYGASASAKTLSELWGMLDGMTVDGSP